MTRVTVNVVLAASVVMTVNVQDVKASASAPGLVSKYKSTDCNVYNPW